MLPLSSITCVQQPLLVSSFACLSTAVCIFVASSAPLAAANASLHLATYSMLTAWGDEGRVQTSCCGRMRTPGDGYRSPELPVRPEVQIFRESELHEKPAQTQQMMHGCYGMDCYARGVRRRTRISHLPAILSFRERRRDGMQMGYS